MTELKVDPELDDILEHHGVKGMQWGVRRIDGGAIPSGVHRRMVKSENRFQDKRAKVNAKAAADRALGKPASKNQFKASVLNAQHRRNQVALKEMGLELYKNVPQSVKNTKVSDL